MESVNVVHHYFLLAMKSLVTPLKAYVVNFLILYLMKRMYDALSMSYKINKESSLVT